MKSGHKDISVSLAETHLIESTHVRLFRLYLINVLNQESRLITNQLVKYISDVQNGVVRCMETELKSLKYKNKTKVFRLYNPLVISNKLLLSKYVRRRLTSIVSGRESWELHVKLIVYSKAKPQVFKNYYITDIGINIESRYRKNWYYFYNKPDVSRYTDD